MVRRTFWMLVGAGLGAWMVVKVQRTASRLTPSGALAAASRHVRHLRSDVAAALDEGRRAKRATEQELRQTVRSRPAIDIASRPALSSPPAPEARLGSPNPSQEMPGRR